MKKSRAVLIVLLLAVPAVSMRRQESRVCRHDGGQSIAFDPIRAERAVSDLEHQFRAIPSRSREIRPSLDAPFDSGIRFCERSGVRRIQRKVPGLLVGKTLLWTAEGGKADLVLRTRARSLRELVEAKEIPGDPSVARQWGVRCVPSRVKILSPDEIEIREGRE